MIIIRSYLITINNYIFIYNFKHCFLFLCTSVIELEEKRNYKNKQVYLRTAKFVFVTKIYWTNKIRCFQDDLSCFNTLSSFVISKKRVGLPKFSRECKVWEIYQFGSVKKFNFLIFSRWFWWRCRYLWVLINWNILAFGPCYTAILIVCLF